MIVVVDYLRTHRTSRILMYRRRFPRDLVKFIPSASPTGRGREMFQFSLGARSINEAGALDRYRELEGEYNAIVEVARRQANRSFDEVTDALVDFFRQTYIHDLLADDDAMRWGRRFEKPTYVTRGHPEELYDECRSLLEDRDLHGIVSFWRDWACDFARAHGFVIDPEGPRMGDLCRGFSEAACQVWLAIDQRIDGVDRATPGKPSQVDRPMPEPEKRASRSLQAIADEVIAGKLSRTGQSTIEAWSTALRYFSEVHGQVGVSDINRAMVSQWLEILAQKPARIPKEERHLPLPEIIGRYSGDEEVSRLSRKTLRGHLASLARVWKLGQERGDLADEAANPFRARSELAGDDPASRAEFTIEELKAIFALPVFTSGERPTRGRGDASYWMPLLLLWTGVRPEEAAQLLTSDFDHDEEGRWLMTITDVGVHPVKGKRSLKTEKKGSSGRRTFVVPGELLRLGLFDYVKNLKETNQVALFPALTVKNKKRGHLYSSVSEWWGEYIREHGVVLEGTGRRPYRDFRQAWATAAREAGIPEEAMSYLMGHSVKAGPQTRTYGQRDAHGWRMADMAYPKLDFSKVLPWGSR